jgi:hypothetical protein
MTVSIVEAARLLWCPGLSQLTGQPQESLHNWLATGIYAPSVTGSSLLLSRIDKQRFLVSLGCDINRLASAASETLMNIAELKDVPKSLAWPYVKLYYASLFYVHAVLRIWGRSPSYFRTDEMMPLRGVVKAYGIASLPFNLTTGQFLIHADMQAESVTLTSESGGGGTHETAWKEFVNALQDLNHKVVVAPFLTEDRKNLKDQLTAFLRLITKNGSHLSWPSQMRNDIQYRQTEGVWYPYQGKSKTSSLQHDVAALLGGGGELTKFLSSGAGDLAQFRSACYAVVCFARGIIDDMSNIGGAKSFLRYGQRRFEDAARP